MEKDIIEKIVKLFDNSYDLINNITLSIIKFYYSDYKYIEIELNEHNSKEPLKIFKNKYNKWLLRKKSLEKAKDKILKKIIKEYKELV